MPRKNMPFVQDFDPNNLPADVRIYGLYAQNKFETTTNRASLIQKVYNRSLCSIWEYNSVKGWICRGRKLGAAIPQGYPCDQCGAALQRRAGAGGYRTYSGNLEGGWAFRRDHTGKIEDPLCYQRLCDYCYTANG